MSKTLRVALFAVGSVCALVLGSSAFASGTCARPMSFLANWTGLHHFCPDEPALAVEMNDNFVTVVRWIEQKVGPVGTSTLTLSGTPVNSATIADGTIVGADLSPAAVGARELLDGGVTASKLASRVPVYQTPAQCPNAGSLTASSTCPEPNPPVICGSAGCSTGTFRYTQCDSTCGGCGVITPTCPRANTFIGFLVGP